MCINPFVLFLDKIENVNKKKDGTNCEFKIEVSRNINRSHLRTSIDQVMFTRGVIK